MTVSARPARYRPAAANPPSRRVPGRDERGIVDMREGSPVRAGTFVFEARDLDSGWHIHDLHQIEYAFEGIAVVETAGTHYLLPPRQAVWIPAGLMHRTTLKHVHSMAVFFDPSMVHGADDRVRVLAVTPLLREMIVHAGRWPIGRAHSDDLADAFFDTLARLVVEWLDDEAPLSLPTSTDPVLRAVMKCTDAHLADATIAEVCATAAVSERSLRRRFAAETGMTWRDYLLQSRLLRAMAQLTESDRTVRDVATDVGFDSVSAFTRAFRRLTGETPTQYRARVRS